MALKRHFYCTLLPWFLLLVICWVFFLLANHKMEKSLPYAGHIDEAHRIDPALKILKTGDFNPGYFHKPSFPIYLTAAGLTAGFIIEASQGKIRSPRQVISKDPAYYDHPGMVKTAKQLFILLSSLAVFFTAYAAYTAYRQRVLLILPALLIPFSTHYLTQTYEYINVNIVGAFFIAATLSYLFTNLKQPGLIKKAVIPGLFCGLVISSKYNFLVIYLPCFLTILLYERAHLLSRSILLVSVSALTVIILNPYFILDLPHFLEDTAYQVNHYLHQGHRGYEGTPGGSQFSYYIRSMVDEFGIGAFLFSLLGLIYMIKLDWKKALIFISYPLGMLLLMSASKANFLRNLTAVYMLWPVFTVMGMLFFYQLLGKIMHRQQKLSAQTQKQLRFGITGFLLLISLPYGVVADFIKSTPDSRNQAVNWIRQHIAKHSTLVVAADLGMDTRPLEKTYTVVKLPGKLLHPDYIAKNYFNPDTYFLFPDYGLDSRFRGTMILHIMDQHIAELFGTGQLQPVTKFDGNKVLLNFYRKTAQGNPGFYVAKYIDE